MLEIVMKWHKSREVFEKECVGYPGFVTKFRVTTNESGEKEDPKNSKDHVDYENYRHVVHKWHFKIAKALVVCLESKDYVQIRNALAILTKILPYFPVITKLNGVIEKRIEKVCNDEKDSRKDIYNKALSYSAQLKKRKHLVMKEHEFHQVAAKPEDGSSSSSKKDNEENKTAAVSANSKKEQSTKENSQVTRDSSSRSQSREKSQSRSERETSEDRKARRERESKSRDRSLASKVCLFKTASFSYHVFLT